MSEMFGYAGWNFIGSASATLRNQGGTILINIFFGPAVNGARAVATQVLHAVDGFAQNFMLAIKPQITQNYASDNLGYMMKLVFLGSRMTFYLLFFISLPVLLNTGFLLNIWLKDVPNHAVLFVQLTLVFTLLEHISGTLITAQLATGKIRNYQLVVGGIQLLNLPISYVVYKSGGFAESFVIVAIACGIACLIARLYMIRPLIGLRIKDFVIQVLGNIAKVSVASLFLPVLLTYYLPESILSFIIVSIVAVLSSGLSIYIIGLNKKERSMLKDFAIKYIKKK